MKNSIMIITLFLALSSKGQKRQDFNLIDQFKLNKMSIEVFFKDPLKSMVNDHADFDQKSGKEKYELLETYLHHNILYIFQATSKAGVTKSYILQGNPTKVRTRNFYDLKILNKNIFQPSLILDNTTNKTLDHLNLGGTFFENMFIFQTSEGKRVVGKAVNMWGFFTTIETYSSVKSTISDIITKDINNKIPDEMIAKPEVKINPLFDYQSCGLLNVKEREITITVYQYDSIGKVVNKYPRIEKDDDLYHSSISNDIGGVTSFPFFGSSDTVKATSTPDLSYVFSSQRFLNYYLQDIKVYKKPNSQNIDRIEGKLLIHGFSGKGTSLDYELYVAEFAEIGVCNLPKTIKFCPIDDLEHKIPRIVSEITYKLKE